MEKLGKDLKILAVFAHPDDETMFLGGTLAYLAAQGAAVHYLSATRGEGGEMGAPPICKREELGRIRENELRCAVKALGGASLAFLGFVDPEVGREGELYPFSEKKRSLIEGLKPHLDKIQPDVILTHGPAGEYGHPAHIQTHQGVMKAVDDMGFAPRALYAPSWLSRETGKFTPAPGIVVDISPWMKEKVAAVNCHRSQHGLFLRHGSSRAGRPVNIPEMVRAEEAFCRILPESDREKDPFKALLQPISMNSPLRE